MLKVITNNVPRDILDGSDLTKKEREDFDYLDWAKIETGEDSASFFRYKGQAYDLGEFSSDWGITRGTGLPNDLSGWHGYQSDSFFSGIVVRYVNDNEQVIVGTYLT
jgi:hypothetical protein